ncbi:MAG: lysozyme inhibitor LprI family protein [Methylococcales bacterium]
MISPRQILEITSLIAGISVAGITIYSSTTKTNEVQNQAISPSFDCTKASNKTESLICASSEIAVLDLTMTNSYRNVVVKRKNPEENKFLKTSQASWLQDVRNNCGDISCLKNVYEQRIAVLNNANR